MALMTFDQDVLVTLPIGDASSPIRLTVSGAMISRSSEFFRTTLKKEWKEGQQRIVKLEEEDDETFMTYLQFLHTGEIVREDEQNNPSEATDAHYFHDQATMFCDLYCLGERMLDNSIRNAVLADFCRITNGSGIAGASWFPMATNVQTIYEGTFRGSPAREVLVDATRHHSDPEYLSRWHLDADVDFFKHLSIRLFEVVGGWTGKRHLLVEDYKL